MAVSAAKHKHWNEMVGLLLFAIGLLITLSLVSYSAIDPCFSVSGSGAAIRNTIGIIGAYLSDALLHLFGLSAYVIPLLMLVYALFFTLGQETTHPLLKKIGGIVLFFSAGAFFGLGSETTRLFGESVPSGGMLGGFIARRLISGFSNTGAYIITLTAMVIALMLLTPFSPLKAFAWLRALSGRLLEQLNILVAVYRGRREKAREARKRPVVPKELLDEETVKYYINPTGRFVVGGPMGDTGLTGRKIIVDSYGGVGSHGGGAFSGKDPTKVDRSGAYISRYIAKNIVAAGIAEKVEVQLAYAIGVPEPVSILVDTYETGRIEEETIAKLIRKNFNLTPKGIIDHLRLRRPIFKKTAAYGHFGKTDPDFTWELTDKAEALKKEAGI